MPLATAGRGRAAPVLAPWTPLGTFPAIGGAGHAVVRDMALRGVGGVRPHVVALTRPSRRPWNVDRRRCQEHAAADAERAMLRVVGAGRGAPA